MKRVLTILCLATSGCVLAPEASVSREARWRWFAQQVHTMDEVRAHATIGPSPR